MQDFSRPVRVALIVGSTRPNRFADHPVQWIVDAAAKRKDLELTTVDLRDWSIPFFEEPIAPGYTGGVYSNDVANRWRQHIGEFDAYIITAAEYNHGPTAVLKNALDSAFKEWISKPVSFVGYGGVGGARAVEQLRLIAIELQMAPIKHAIHINADAYLGVLRDGRSFDEFPFLADSREAMFNQLVWWARALRAARTTATELAA